MSVCLDGCQSIRRSGTCLIERFSINVTSFLEAKSWEIDVIIPPVKKLILILLLAILPIQYSWAAAAAYCQHEQAQHTPHFGHHSHQHQATDEGGKDTGTSKQAHSDCEVCHFSVQASFLGSVYI